MKIGLDLMGGDYAPQEAIEGIQQYFSEGGNGHLVLIGDEEKIRPLLSSYSFASEKFSVVHAPEVIDFHDSPTRALKEKPKSSISIGFHLLATGKTVSEIASQLSLSSNTVSTYRARILDKMNMHSNNELMRYALELKLF